ncbi:MAG TPA: GGDEF domain-containing phosphodiesterase, partial [Phycisphaerae bacterium]|nr:GGDEF domain-containing phosphodiesterase [Phycisphaerae bacterium]
GRPFAIDGHDVVANLSVGIAIGSARYERAADLLRDADTAVYRAKRAGKHQTAVFDSEMHREARKRLEVEADIREAVGNGQILLHYQPVVSLTNGNIRGFEALARLVHPLHGIVEPAEFVAVAEETGLIIPMGFQIIRDACRQVKMWRTRFADHPDYRNLRVAVNLSARQLSLASLVDQIDAITAEFELEHDALELEITESVVMEQGDMAIRTLSRLGERGYLLALDDFGTGYSSLSHLHQVPVNFIKIDQSFVRKLEGRDRSFSATVKAIIDLAHNCGLRVIGEGVETLNHLVQLQALDCDNAQGFWFSHPVAPAAAERLLVDNLGNSLWRKRVEELARKGTAALTAV